VRATQEEGVELLNLRSLEIVRKREEGESGALRSNFLIDSNQKL